MRYRMQRPYFVSGRGKSCISALWKQAAKVESATKKLKKGTPKGERNVSVALSTDSVKFYESFSIMDLKDRASKQGMPMPILKVLINQMLCMRIVEWRGMVARKPAYSLHGLPAGSAFTCCQAQASQEETCE